MNLKVLSVCFSVCLLLVGNIHAQEVENISSEFSVLSWKRTIDGLYYENANGEEIEFFAPNGAPSEVYDYVGPVPLNFYKYVGVDEDGNPLRKVVASYVPKTGDKHLLLFIPDAKNRHEENYRLLPLEYSPDTIADGTYRFFNMASYPVYIRFGEETLKVEAGRSDSIRSNPSAADGLDVAMALQVSEAPNSAQVVYSAGWTLKFGRSALVFITNDRGIKGRIDVKRVYF